MPGFDDIAIVFDATSAASHARHDAVLRGHSKQIVDLTPAAIGPYVVPAVNLQALAEAPNLNMVTCGGQATIPTVAAVSRVTPVMYAEIVSSIASKSAGPGTRANIDEFTQTTARAIERVGGAQRGKAIIILNPAEPPLIMRNTVFCFAEDGDPKAIEASVEQMAAEVRTYVPGFRLKQAVQFEPITKARPIRIDDVGAVQPRPEDLGLPRGRRRGTLPAEIRRQSRHHDVGRAPYRRAPGHGQLRPHGGVA